MSFKFNLFPTQPQKSYYPKGQRDSTSNSLYNKEVSTRSLTNESELFTAAGKSITDCNDALVSRTRQNSAPNLFKKQGSSKTYNDGTGSRLLKLKANAINGSNKCNK